MSPNPRSSIRRHPFLSGSFLLALLIAAVAGLNANARVKASREGAAKEIPAGSRAATAAIGPATLSVKDGRDFAGFYEEVSATDLGESRYVSLKFRIFNYSDKDVSGATIRISDRLTNESTWSRAGVSIEDRHSIVVSGEFTVAQTEYENWQKGASPYLNVEYQNAQGEKIQRPVELIRMVIGEVQ